MSAEFLDSNVFLCQEGCGPPIEVEAALRPYASTYPGWTFPTADLWHPLALPGRHESRLVSVSHR